MMNTNKVAIIGGGISGLTFARLCKEKNIDFILLEKADELGGCIATHHFSECDKVEMGAHTSYNTYASLLDLINQEQCIDQMEKKGKGSFKLYEGGFISMLRKLNVLELITHLAKMPWTNKSGKTISEYYSKVLGKKNYDAVFNHMFSALLSQNAKTFRLKCFLKKEKHRRNFQRSSTLKMECQLLFYNWQGT